MIIGVNRWFLFIPHMRRQSATQFEQKSPAQPFEHSLNPSSLKLELALDSKPSFVFPIAWKTGPPPPPASPKKRWKPPVSTPGGDSDEEPDVADAPGGLAASKYPSEAGDGFSGVTVFADRVVSKGHRIF